MKENDSSNKSQTNNENEPIPGGVNPLYYHSLKQKMNIDYSDFDAQKGNLSPRYLFKKRKNSNIVKIFNELSRWLCCRSY